MRRSLLPLLFAVLVLAACGGGGGGGSVPEDADVVIRGVENFEFDPAEATAEAGAITVALDNQDSQRHTLVIDEAGFKIDAQANAADSGTVELEAGTYTFYCDIPGHRAAGMEGTLEVE